MKLYLCHGRHTRWSKIDAPARIFRLAMVHVTASWRASVSRRIYLFRLELFTSISYPLPSSLHNQHNVRDTGGLFQVPSLWRSGTLSLPYCHTRAKRVRSCPRFHRIHQTRQFLDIQRPSWRNHSKPSHALPRAHSPLRQILQLGPRSNSSSHPTSDNGCLLTLLPRSQAPRMSSRPTLSAPAQVALTPRRLPLTFPTFNSLQMLTQHPTRLEIRLQP